MKIKMNKIKIILTTKISFFTLRNWKIIEIDSEILFFAGRALGGGQNCRSRKHKNRPWTKAPFSAGWITSSGPLIDEILVWIVILSNAIPFVLAVNCIIAVKKDIGLKRYEMLKLKGVIKSLDQLISYVFLSIISWNHIIMGFLEK